MPNKSVNLRYWSRLATSLLFAFNLGSHTANVLAYLRPLEQGTTAGRGEPYLYLHSDDDGPTTWDCSQPIRIAVNLRNLPDRHRADALRDLQAVMDLISSQSSFQLQLVGETSVIPTTEWAQSWRSDSPSAPVVVAFGDASDTDLFEPNSMAVGGFFQGEESDGRTRAVVGFVYVHTGHFIRLKAGTGFMSRGALLAHELLHVLGLGHVHPSSRDSVMTPWLSSSLGKIGPGDVLGLERLAEVGCPSTVP